jgi:hypothetical protein
LQAAYDAMQIHRMIRRALVLIACLPLVAAAQGTAPQTPPKPEIFVREPANGATVTSPVTVVFGLRNYGVAPAGIKVDNTGHFHVIIDGPAPAVGTVIPPNDAVNRHFGTGVIETKLTLTPGTHTLRLVLGDFEHKVISAELISAPVTITVK